MGALAAAFRSVSPDAEAPADLDDRLARAWRTARETWPALPDDAESFSRHVAGRLPADLSVEAGLGNLRAADLYLALHAARACEPAVEAFLAGPFTVARATLYKIRCPAELVPDVEQQLRALFLVGDHPKLLDYAGRGDLASWIASIAARVARKRMAAEHRRADAPARDELTDLAAGDDDPELEYFKHAYREAFAAAVRDALVVLTPRERNLLRQHHLDALTLDELAAFHGVHRATVARWLAAARDRIAEETRTLIGQRLALDADEFESMVKLVESQVHVSLGRLLAT